MTTLDAILVLIPALGSAFVWYKVGRVSSKNYYQGWKRGFDMGYEEGRKDGFEEGRMAREQAWWDQMEAQMASRPKGKSNE
jgi:hypothetical protein